MAVLTLTRAAAGREERGPPPPQRLARISAGSPSSGFERPRRRLMECLVDRVRSGDGRDENRMRYRSRIFKLWPNGRGGRGKMNLRKTIGGRTGWLIDTRISCYTVIAQDS